MRKLWKKITAVALSAAVIFVFAGCGNKDFDAKGYVQAVLDAKYQRNYDAYAKGLGVSVDEAKKQMEGEFNDSLAQEVKAAGFQVTDEELKEYQQLEADLRAKVKYEVKDAVKGDDDNYEVDVVITSNDAYEKLQSGFEDKLVEAINNGTDESGYMRVLLDLQKECIDNAKEKSPVTMTLHVTYEDKDKQRVYSISEEEMMQLDMKMTGQ